MAKRHVVAFGAAYYPRLW